MFLYNDASQDYDYLVVFDDLPAPIQPRCPLNNVIHLASEPPSVHRYHPDYMSQFAWCVTQDAALRRPGVIRHHAGLHWFIGRDLGDAPVREDLNFPQLKALFGQPKSKKISVIASNRASTAGHRARLEFAMKLKEHYGEAIDFYGRGYAPFGDKLEALGNYRFHVVLENSVYDHYFSEKLTDCFLAGSYPIYSGCPNLTEYFPSNSFVSIDITRLDQSIASIDAAISQSFDEKYQAELLEARDLVLYKHNLYPMLTSLIGRIELGEFGKPGIPVHHDDFMIPYGQGSSINRASAAQPGRDTSKNTAYSKIKRLLFGLNRR